MSVWPLEKLGSVLDKSENWIEVQPGKEYSEVTVRLWGKGVNLRGTKIGSEIGASRRLSVSEGQFIISRIDARHGACGLVPKNLDGAVDWEEFKLMCVPLAQTRRVLMLPLHHRQHHNHHYEQV